MPTKRFRRVALIVVVLAAALWTGTPNAWAGGKILWQYLDDGCHNLDEAHGVAVADSMVFTTGVHTSCPAQGGENFLVRAHEPKHGDVPWEDLYDGAGQADRGLAVAAVSGTVVGAGYVTNVAGNKDFFVRAYDDVTGQIAWTDQFDAAGGDDVARTVAIHGSLVFAAGYVTTGGQQHIAVRAYDLASGGLVWHDQATETSGAFSLVPGKGRVFVVGSTYSTSWDLFLRAYDESSGARLWTKRYDNAGAEQDGYAVASVSGIVAAVGTDTDVNGSLVMMVRAYRADTGKFAWMSTYAAPGGEAQGLAAAAANGEVFAAGYGDVPVVRALDARTGGLLWEDISNKLGAFGVAQAVTEYKGEVFTGGYVYSQSGNSYFDVRAYNEVAGIRQWENFTNLGFMGESDQALGVAADGRRAFAAGSGVPNAMNGSDELVRAYLR